jgi:hypothetical protein
MACQVFKQDTRALQRRHHGEALRQETRGHQCGFAQAQNGKRGERAGCIKPCIIKAGYDGRIEHLRFGDL